MQARVYFVDDTSAPDYTPGTSFKAIDLIYTSSIGFFERLQPQGTLDRASVRKMIGITDEEAPAQANELEDVLTGLRACRVARVGDAKLSEEDILAWDHLVRSYIIPWNRSQITALEAEIGGREVPVGDAYDSETQDQDRLDRALSQGVHGILRRSAPRRFWPLHLNARLLTHGTNTTFQP